MVMSLCAFGALYNAGWGRRARPLRPLPVMQLTQAPGGSGSTQLFLDMKKAMTAQAAKERELLEPNMSEMGLPKPKRARGGKTSRKTGSSGGFGSGGDGSGATAAHELRVETMAADGVCYVPGVLSKSSTAMLRKMVLAELASAYAAVEADPEMSVSRFNVPVQTHDPFRGYLLLPLRDEASVLGNVARGPMVQILQELLAPGSQLGRLFESTCGGGKAEFYDLVALRTEPGAARQPLHSDTPFQKTAGLFCVFIATQDVPFSMGSTLFLPGTHKNNAQRQAIVDGAQYADGRRGAMLGKVKGRYSMLKAGDAAFFDMRTIHAGTANFPPEDGGAQRLIFALTFRNRKAKEPLEHAPNLRPGYRNRGITLEELRGELGNPEPDYVPFAGLCGDDAPYGDGLS